MVTMSKEYQRNYYQQNKGKYIRYNSTEFCEQCQCVYKKKYRARHLRTNKHRRNAEEQPVRPIAEVAVDIKQKRDEVKQLLSQIKNLEKKNL